MLNYVCFDPEFLRRAAISVTAAFEHTFGALYPYTG